MRLIRIFVFAVLVVTGTPMTVNGCRAFQELGTYEGYELMHMPVDFSEPGEYVGPCRIEWLPVHGYQFRLFIDPPFASREEALAALDGLHAKLTVKTLGGTPEYERDLTPEDFANPTEYVPACADYAPMPPETPWFFVDWRAFKRLKRCNVTLTVSEPVTSLAGRQQMIDVRSVWCCTRDAGYFFVGCLLTGIGAVELLLAAVMAWYLWGKRPPGGCDAVAAGSGVENSILPE